MNLRLRGLIALVFIGSGVLAISLVVIIRNTSLDDELLATVGILGGLAIVITTVLELLAKEDK